MALVTRFVISVLASFDPFTASTTTQTVLGSFPLQLRAIATLPFRVLRVAVFARFAIASDSAIELADPTALTTRRASFNH